MLDEYDFSKAKRMNMSTQCNKPNNPTPFPGTNQMSTGNSTASNIAYTTTYASSNWQNPQKTYNPQYGWECPRCHCINAPWVRQCECKRNTYTYTTITSNDPYTIKPSSISISADSNKAYFTPTTDINTAYCLNQSAINSINSAITTNPPHGGSCMQDD